MMQAGIFEKQSMTSDLATKTKKSTVSVNACFFTGDHPVMHVWEQVQFPCSGPSFGLAPTLLGPYLVLVCGLFLPALLIQSLADYRVLVYLLTTI